MRNPYLASIIRRRHVSCAAMVGLLLLGNAFALGGEPPREGAVPAAPADRAANRANGDPVMLSIFQVTGDKDEGYRSSQTVSGSRTISDLRDTPSSISILNRELLDDLIATQLVDAMFFAVTGEVNTNREANGDAFVFRGIPGAYSFRNGVNWNGGVIDTFSIERVELLRGPHAFLYGEGHASGLHNQLTKQAAFSHFQRMNVIFGSNDLRRAEIDVNRRLTNTLALRAAATYAHEGSFQHHANREFKGIYTAATWRPFRGTHVHFDLEYSANDGVMGSNILSDGFSTTDRTQATTALSATTGGRTHVPALGITYDSTGLRRSSGTNLVLRDENILPREYSFLGPNAPRDSSQVALDFSVDQRFSDVFNVQISYTRIDAKKRQTERVGSSAGAVYRDTNPTLPNGTPNPYFNELYTEYYRRTRDWDQLTNNARITGVYELKLPFTSQKIVGSAVYHDSMPNEFRFTEFVDPASGNFKGTLNPANTLAAYTANNAVMSQNFFYRRFYLKDGDRAELTGTGIVAGQSRIQRDGPGDGSTGRSTDRLFRVPGYGIGADGSYFGGRIHTLVGWRRSAFHQELRKTFYNSATGETYSVDSVPPVPTRITEDTVNYGAVVHFSRNVGAYYNFAQSVGLSSGIGTAQLTPGKFRGPVTGDGQEIGLRWSLLGGRIESNWTYYITNALRNAASPAIPVVVRQTELGTIFGGEIDTAGTDIQTSRATGLEFESVTNITKTWRLTWNVSTNDLVLSDRYPQLKAFQALARSRGAATPETDAFLSSVPDGTPLPGFTKVRSNLVTMYRFDRGPWKDFSAGVGLQYRDKTYRGNYDLDRDGVAEKLWSRGYTLGSVMFGYRTKIAERRVNLSLNINNVFDKDYFRSFDLGSGSWGEGRNFRFAARMEL